MVMILIYSVSKFRFHVLGWLSMVQSKKCRRSQQLALIFTLLPLWVSNPSLTLTKVTSDLVTMKAGGLISTSQLLSDADEWNLLVCRM